MESHRIFRIPTKSPFRSGTSITPLSAFFACSVNCMPSQCGFIRFPQNFPTARVLTALRAIYAKAALRSQAARLSLPEYFLFPCEDTVPCHFRSREPATDAHPAFFARPSFSRNSACAHRRRNHTALKRTAEDNPRHGGILPQRFYIGDTRQRRFIPRKRIRIRPRPPNVWEISRLPYSPGAFSAKNNAHESLHAHCSFISLSSFSHVPQRASSRRAAPRAPPPASPERTRARAASPRQCPPASAGRRPYRPSSPRPAPSFR